MYNPFFQKGIRLCSSLPLKLGSKVVCQQAPPPPSPQNQFFFSHPKLAPPPPRYPISPPSAWARSTPSGRVVVPLACLGFFGPEYTISVVCFSSHIVPAGNFWLAVEPHLSPKDLDDSVLPRRERRECPFPLYSESPVCGFSKMRQIKRSALFAPAAQIVRSFFFHLFRFDPNSVCRLKALAFPARLSLSSFPAAAVGVLSCPADSFFLKCEGSLADKHCESLPDLLGNSRPSLL